MEPSNSWNVRTSTKFPLTMPGFLCGAEEPCDDVLRFNPPAVAKGGCRPLKLRLSAAEAAAVAAEAARRLTRRRGGVVGTAEFEPVASELTRPPRRARRQLRPQPPPPAGRTG